VRAVQATCVSVGIPKFNPAWMRHTNARHAVQVGSKTEKVCEALGYSQIRCHGAVSVDDRLWLRLALPQR